jgi:hypothetical protein
MRLSVPGCEGATYEEFGAHVARVIAEQGWAIQGVERLVDRAVPGCGA